MIGIFFICFYGTFALIALVNLVFMRRVSAKNSSPPVNLCILIPARNESKNLARLIPALLGSGSEGVIPPKVYVFDDESEDDTAEVAARCGAVVIRPSESLPKGWTGKNRACHELALAANAMSSPEWILFLDADVYPERGFVSALANLIQQIPSRTSVVSGFPKILPGRGIEPLFLAWVGWVLLSTNPYGIVTVTGKGHNRFTNGQFGLWRSNVYAELRPNELLKGQILEDVLIGRLCAKKNIGVEIVNLSGVLAVKMYETWRETLDGMSKNTYEIAGSVPGSIGLAALFLVISWGWLLAGTVLPYAAALFALSGIFCAMTVRTKPYGIILLPIVTMIGSFTILRSMVWHKRGRVTWKGRTYS